MKKIKAINYADIELISINQFARIFKIVEFAELKTFSKSDYMPINARMIIKEQMNKVLREFLAHPLKIEHKWNGALT